MPRRRRRPGLRDRDAAGQGTLSGSGAVRSYDRPRTQTARTASRTEWSTEAIPTAAGRLLDVRRRLCECGADGLDLDRARERSADVTLAPARRSPKGSSAALHANAADIDGDALTYTWSATAGTISGDGADVSLPTVTALHRCPSSVTVSDGQAHATADRNVQVDNAPPTVSAGGALTADVGGTVGLAGASFADPGGRDTHSATVDWGDGSGVQPATIAGTSVTAGHTYSAHGDLHGHRCRGRRRTAVSVQGRRRRRSRGKTTPRQRATRASRQRAGAVAVC